MVNRDLSTALKAQLFKPWRDKDLRYLLTFDHATFSVPYRFVSGDPNEFATLDSNGDTFQTFPFQITIVSDGEGTPQAELTIQNVDDRIGSTILDLPDDAVNVTLQIVLRESPNTIEYEVTGLELVDVVISALTVTGSLIIRGLATEPCPGRVLTSLLSPIFFK